MAAGLATTRSVDEEEDLTEEEELAVLCDTGCAGVVLEGDCDYWPV